MTCREIAASQRYAGPFCGIQQTVQELVSPALRQFRGHGQREEGRNRFAAHGSNVGESAGEAAMADRIGRMPLTAEVHPFEAEIGGDQRLCASHGVEHGAIVSNGAKDASWGRAPSGWVRGKASLRDAFDKTIFRDRHDRTEYSETGVRGKKQARTRTESNSS